MRHCQFCLGSSSKFIYYGLPHHLCDDRACNGFFGFFSQLTQWLPFNGSFMRYEGDFWRAHLHWLLAPRE